MSTFLRWRTWRALIIRFWPYAATAVALPVIVFPYYIYEEHVADSLSNLGILLAFIGVMFLCGQPLIRTHQQLNEILLMQLSAASADAIRAYMEPNSRWRLRLIKEIADDINSDNESAIRAMEDSLFDLAVKFGELSAKVDALRSNK